MCGSQSHDGVGTTVYLRLTHGGSEINAVVGVIDVHQSHGSDFVGEVYDGHQTDLREDGQCDRDNVVQLEILERQAHVLARLLRGSTQKLDTSCQQPLERILGSRLGSGLSSSCFAGNRLL